MDVVSHSPAQHILVPQPGVKEADEAAAALHAVLRVAAAEQPTRPFTSLILCDLERRGHRDASSGDSFGVASFGSVSAQPKLTPVAPGEWRSALSSHSWRAPPNNSSDKSSWNEYALEGVCAPFMIFQHFCQFMQEVKATCQPAVLSMQLSAAAWARSAT